MTTWTTTPSDGWHWHRAYPDSPPRPCLVRTRRGGQMCVLWRMRSWVPVRDVLGEWCAMTDHPVMVDT